MAPSPSPTTPKRLRAAAARVARIKALKERTPPTSSLFCLLCVLLRMALMVQMLVTAMEQVQLAVAIARPDYYYEKGRPPKPYTFDDGGDTPPSVEAHVSGRHSQVRVDGTAICSLSKVRT